MAKYKIWCMAYRESRFKCFEILPKAFNCLAALEQPERM